MKKAIICVFGLAMLATPALADDYWVVRDSSTKHCSIVTEKPTAARFVELLDKLGRKARVGVFRRFGIMRYWNEGQKLPFQAFVKDDGLHMNDWAYDCTARLLAGAILEAAARTPRVL